MTQAQKTKLLMAAMKIAAVNSAMDMHMYPTTYETKMQSLLKDALVLLDDLAKEPVCHA